MKRPDATLAAKESANWLLGNVETLSINALRHAPLIKGMQLGWTLPDVDMTFAETKESLRVLAPFTLVVHDAASTASAPRLLTIGMTLALTYRRRPGAPPSENVDDFAGTLGFMHSWPYFRAEVQALTAKLGLPALTLPIVLSGNVPGLARIRRQAAEVPEIATPKKKSKRNLRSK
jgi:hypothetical protein